MALVFESCLRKQERVVPFVGAVSMGTGIRKKDSDQQAICGCTPPNGRVLPS